LAARRQRNTDKRDDRDSDSLALVLGDAMRAVQRVFSERIRDIGISAAQWPCLRVLNEGDGITQRELADRAKISGATLVPIVRWLAARGYLKRKSDPADRRKVRIFLTAKGRATCGRVIPEIRTINAAAARSMSRAELKQLKKSLRSLQSDVLARDG